MAKIVVIVDNHNRDEPIFFEATRAFYSWLVRQDDLNVPENTLLDGGDHWHRSRPSPTEYDLFYSEFNRHLRFGRKIALRGNHDRATPSDGTSTKETNSIDPLASQGWQVILQGTVLPLGALTCVLLPYQHDYALMDANGAYVAATKAEYYAKVQALDLSSLSCPDFDRPELTMVDKIRMSEKSKVLCFYHFPDETQTMFGASRGVDLSPLAKAGWRLIGADIHIQTDRYVGPPRPTRADEAGLRGRIAIIDDQTGAIEYRSCPRFLDFVKVRYGEQPVLNPEGETFLIVEEAPSESAAKEMYGDKVYDVKIEVMRETPEMLRADKDASGLSLEEHLQDFYEDRKVDVEVQKIVDEALACR
jgi:hypothetical protein